MENGPLAAWSNRELGSSAGESVQATSEVQRVSKQGTLYLHVLPDESGYQTQYQCKDCPMFIEDTYQCTIHGPEDAIMPYGTCGYWVYGEPTTSGLVQPSGAVTKLQSGYVENEPGFSCKRCKAFVPQYDNEGNLTDMGGCDVVDYNTPGDDPGAIHPHACCAAWTADELISQMTDEEFPAVVQSQ